MYFGITAYFAVMVMPAFAATGDYEDINDFFESASNETQTRQSTNYSQVWQGVGAVKRVKPIWNPAKFTTWFVIGLAVIIGVLTFAGHFLKANIGSVADKVKWVISGQKGMLISGLLLLVFIIYLSVIKFIAHF